MAAATAHMDDLVFRTLLKADPSSSVGRQLLRLLHPVSSAGRLAALHVPTFLMLYRAHELGLPYSHQLSVLAATSRVGAVIISSGQVPGLLRALLIKQRQQQEAAAEKEGEGDQDQQEEEGEHREEERQLVLPGQLAAESQGARLQWVIVEGKLPPQGMRLLVRLLDLLPGTQYMQTLSLDEMDNTGRWEKKNVLLAPRRQPPHAEAGGGSGSSASASSGAAASSSSSSSTGGTGKGGGSGKKDGHATSSWRNSCSCLSAQQSALTPTNARLRDLCPLLEALTQLQQLSLSDILVNALPRGRRWLGSVRALSLSGSRILYGPQMLPGPALLGGAGAFGAAGLLGGAGVLAGAPPPGALLGAGGVAGGGVLPGAGALPGLFGGAAAAPGAGAMGGAAVPPEFGVLNAVATLTQLQVLSLRLCSPAVTPWQQAQPQRVTLPGSLLRLKGLRCLDLSHTNIHRDTLELLPDFEGLEELILSGSVGDGDARLLTNTLPLVTGLTSLKLQYSPISSLPMGMAGLSRLRKLSWSCGRAKTTLMPLVFGSHAALRMDVVWRLTGLHSLTFSDDTMVALPAGITRLTQLTELSFEAINMSAPPVHLSNLISLQAISIKSRHLAAVMEGVTNLTQLKQVIVSNLQALPPAAKAFVEARTPAWLRGG